MLAAALLVVLAVARAGAGWLARGAAPASRPRGTLLPPLAIRGAPGVGDARRQRCASRSTRPGDGSVALRSRATGAAWARTDGRASSGARRRPCSGPLDADLTLVASDGRALSDTVTVRVRDRAFVGDVAIAGGLSALSRASAAEPLAAGEPLRVPRGTVLRVEARASADLAAIGVVRERRGATRCASRRRRAAGAACSTSGWGACGTGSRGAAGGPIADVPAPLEVQVVARPGAARRDPRAGGGHGARGGGVVTLRLAASDDHGVAAVALRAWREHGGRAGPVSEQRLARPGAAAWATEVPIDLASRGLEPGDALHLVLAVTDDSPWRQTGESRALVIRVPTLEETRALARALGDSAAARTAAAAARGARPRAADARGGAHARRAATARASRAERPRRAR